MNASSKICRKPTVKQCWSCVPEKKVAIPAGQGRELILSIWQGLKDEGFDVSISKLCYWFGVPRRTFYYKPVKAAPRLQPTLVERVKALIEDNLSFGYRTVAGLLGMNKNTVQRIFQLKGWQVRKRATGIRPRVQALSSVAGAPNERWATDLCRVWGGRDGWLSLAWLIATHVSCWVGSCPEVAKPAQRCLLWSRR